ncbi:MAG: ABC transporter substrate-binding protein [Pseudomonadota bacterium]
MTYLTSLTRRAALTVGFLAAFAFSTPAHALAQGEAEQFVDSVLEDLRGLITDNAEGAAGAARFLSLLEEHAAVSQVGKFAVGRNWRSMSDAQQADFQEAFRGYISRTYQRRFGDYAGEDILIDDSVDAGRKGVLVKSRLTRPGQPDIAVEWLVTDRLGPPKIADIIFEGVSLSITLREVFGSMIEQRGGDIDQFIADLSTSSGA